MVVAAGGAGVRVAGGVLQMMEGYSEFQGEGGMSVPQHVGGHRFGDPRRGGQSGQGGVDVSSGPWFAGAGSKDQPVKFASCGQFRPQNPH